MFVNCTNIHFIQCDHHLLCQPYIFIFIAHFNTVLLVTDGGNVSRIFRCPPIITQVGDKVSDKFIFPDL